MDVEGFVVVGAQHAAPLRRKLYVYEDLFNDHAEKLFLPDAYFVRAGAV